VFWSESSPYYWGSNTGTNQTVVAPAKNVLSTVYTGYDWNPAMRCGDSTGFPYPQGMQQGSAAGLGYGSCTGTSMATPHVTGIVALLRSVNPLLGNSATRQLLVANSSRSISGLGWNSQLGYGVPDANAAVSAALAQTNRLTPLFSLYSGSAQNYFYTTVPQMAITAVRGYVLPRPVYATLTPYDTVGTSVNEYSQFPVVSVTGVPPPRAQVWIFTTPKDPTSVEPLAPLYRLSWKCGDSTPMPVAVCTTYPNHVDHTYTTDTAGLDYFRGLGYQLDGIEGYVYPTTRNQPPGTVKLYRKYNPGRDDHAIFPETVLSAMTVEGYTVDVGNPWIGYVYLNTGPRPSY
jgi:serine protease